MLWNTAHGQYIEKCKCQQDPEASNSTTSMATTRFFTFCTQQNTHYTRIPSTSTYHTQPCRGFVQRRATLGTTWILRLARDSGGGTHRDPPTFFSLHVCPVLLVHLIHIHMYMCMCVCVCVYVCVYVCVHAKHWSTFQSMYIIIIIIIFGKILYKSLHAHNHTHPSSHTSLQDGHQMKASLTNKDSTTACHKPVYPMVAHKQPLEFLPHGGRYDDYNTCRPWSITPPADKRRIAASRSLRKWISITRLARQPLAKFTTDTYPPLSLLLPFT